MKIDDSLQCCLRCNFFRLKSKTTGCCRKEKNSTGAYEQKGITDKCSFWQDCGQNYFIRKGWIKSQEDLADNAV